MSPAYFSSQTLAAYKAALAPQLHQAKLFEFSQTPLDRLGFPLWSVAIIGQDGALSDGFGYGPSLEYAQMSAWGECVEWFGARDALRVLPRVRASYHQLQTRGHAAVDPRALNLSAGSDYSPEHVCEWIEAARYPDNAKFWVPIEFVAPRAADIRNGELRIENEELQSDSSLHSPFSIPNSPFLSVPITNGLGAGPNFAHALAHGLLELLQRDGNSVNYRALDCGVRVHLGDDFSQVQDESTRELLKQLNAQNVEVLVKLAATDFGLTNLYVVGYDRDLESAPQPIMLSACGEAVHPDREFALAKALREFVSARARKAFNHGPLSQVRRVAPTGYLEAFETSSLRSEDERALQEMRAWTKLSHREFFELLQPIFAVRQSVQFSDLPTVAPDVAADAQARLQLLSERLHAENLQILYVDFSPPDAPVSILRAIVPGLEVETMTYERIGARNLQRLLQRGSPLVGEGAPPEGSHAVRLPGEDDRRFWFSSREKERALGNLYALYREPGRHVIGLLEERE